jgi:thiamine-monophosphate kinase
MRQSVSVMRWLRFCTRQQGPRTTSNEQRVYCSCLPLPERELIAQIRRAAGAGRGVARGIGDDCAVLRIPAGHEALVTTDFSLEDVHFRREWHPAESVGHRCLTRGLSDIAAMGGEPIAAFLSLALPGDLPQEWVHGFLRGFAKLARKFNITLAGGDTAQSPPLPGGNVRVPSGAGARRALDGGEAAGKILADVVVVGSVARGKAVLRSGARAGDDIFVTGTLGGAAAVLHRLMAEAERGKSRARAGVRPADGLKRRLHAKGIEHKHFFPTPRIEVGRWLRARGLASAMIDLSDGLSTDLTHICEESGAGAWIAEPAVPVAPGASFEEALNGGDDYELLFTAPAARHGRIPERIAGVTVRWIGTVTKRPGVWLVAPDMKSRRELKPRGWEHFRQ